MGPCLLVIVIQENAFVVYFNFYNKLVELSR